MKKYFFRLCWVVLIGVSGNSIAQDIHFSQFDDMSTMRNPALTGIFSGEYKFGLNYRSQWSAVSTPYSTVAIAGETRILVDRNIGDYLSFGLNAFYDKAGSIDFVTQEVYPAVAFNKCMEDDHHSYLSVGLAGGFFSRSVDMSKMTLSSQYQNRTFDPSNPTFENTPFNSLQNYDIGAGVSLNSSFDLDGRSNYYVGAALYHINHPTEIFYGAQVLVKLPLKWQFNTGFHVNMGEQAGITFHGNYSIQGPYSEFIGGGLLTWHNTPIGYPSNFAVNLGAYWRYQDAIIPTIRFDIRNVSLGFSYDITNSSLATSVSGASATEITLFVRGVYNHRKDPRDNVMCPRFDDKVWDHFKN